MSISARPDAVICYTAATVPLFTVAVSDPATRRIEYEHSIRRNSHQIRNLNDCNVAQLCVDTGAEASRELHAVCTENAVEYVHLCVKPPRSNTGKGAGEFAALCLIADAYGTSVPIFKLTGRLFSPELARYVRRIVVGSRYDIWLNLTNGGLSSDTRLFAARGNFFGYLSAGMQMLNDPSGFYFEHVMARACFHARQDGMGWRPFALGLRISGRSGSTGESYRHQPLSRLNAIVKNWIRWRCLQGTMPALAGPRDRSGA
jgi:hypothetical protein